MISTAPNSNGWHPRKTLSDQIDRLDGILDGLADGLSEAVHDAVHEGATKAVWQVLFDVADCPQAQDLFRRVLGLRPEGSTGANTEAAATVLPGYCSLAERCKQFVATVAHALVTLVGPATAAAPASER